MMFLGHLKYFIHIIFRIIWERILLRPLFWCIWMLSRYQSGCAEVVTVKTSKTCISGTDLRITKVSSIYARNRSQRCSNLWQEMISNACLRGAAGSTHTILIFIFIMDFITGIHSFNFRTWSFILPWRNSWRPIAMTKIDDLKIFFCFKWVHFSTWSSF